MEGDTERMGITNWKTKREIEGMEITRRTNQGPAKPKELFDSVGLFDTLFFNILLY